MSRNASDVLEEIRWHAEFATENARQARYSIARSALEDIRELVPEAERRLKQEIEYKHEVERNMRATLGGESK